MRLVTIRYLNQLDIRVCVFFIGGDFFGQAVFNIYDQLRPVYINSECVEMVHTSWFLGVHIYADISWTDNISAIIMVLRKLDFDCNLSLTFYRSSIERLLTYCITVVQRGSRK